MLENLDSFKDEIYIKMKENLENKINKDKSNLSIFNKEILKHGYGFENEMD